MSNKNNFNAVCPMTKDVTDGHKFHDDSVKEVNDKLLTDDDEQIKGCKEHFATDLNRIASKKILSILDELAKYHNMRVLLHVQTKSYRLAIHPSGKRPALTCLPQKCFLQSIVSLEPLVRPF